VFPSWSTPWHGPESDTRLCTYTSSHKTCDISVAPQTTCTIPCILIQWAEVCNASILRAEFSAWRDDILYGERALMPAGAWNVREFKPRLIQLS
jgi:hypothetical protein